MIQKKAVLNKPKILLVEDEPLVQQVHLMMLRELGCDVDLAENGRKALKCALKKYSVIFMDIGLPDINGIDVAKKIRHNDVFKSRKCCIVALTAYIKSEVEASCIAAGIDFVESKPVEIKKLQQIIYKRI